MADKKKSSEKKYKRTYKKKEGKYCGAEKLKSGDQYGSLVYCSNLGQNRLWSKDETLRQNIKALEVDLHEYRKKLDKFGASLTQGQFYFELVNKYKRLISETKAELRELEKFKKEHNQNIEKLKEKKIKELNKKYA